MSLALYQVDAFTDTRFAGNPAAVVPLDAWLPDALLQQIAAENNLSETAYLVPAGDSRWELRWFTPRIEVPLCGHATLASAFVLAEIRGEAGPVMTFVTRVSGDLTVTREGGRYAMRLPIRRVASPRAVDPVAAALGARPLEVLTVPAAGDDTALAVFATEAEVRALQPDMRALGALPVRNVIATAPGTSSDFVSRMFAPKAGIDEDPVTGSAHAVMVPYFAGVLGRATMTAYQASARGGRLGCELAGDRVILMGDCVTVIEGSFLLP